MAYDPWLLGEHLTAVTITPLTIASNGAITPGSAVVLTDHVMVVSPTQSVESEDIRPVNSTFINQVPHSQGDSVRLSVLQKSASANLLNSAIRACTSKRFIIAWTQGAESFSGYYTFQSQTGGVQNRGGNTIDADFAPSYPGSAPMTYS